MIDASLESINHHNFDGRTALNERLCNEKQIHKDVIAENATETTHDVSCSSKLKPADNDEPHNETGVCHRTSKTLALETTNRFAVNELIKSDTKSSKFVAASPNSGSHVVKVNEPFCLAGPRRALCSQNTSVFASSSSTVLKTSGQTPPTVCSAASFSGDVPVKNERLSNAHVPIIRSKNAANAVVSSAIEKTVAVNQRKPGSIATNTSHSSLSNINCLVPHVRLSAHSPQPPTKPASRPAVAATQARFA